MARRKLDEINAGSMADIAFLLLIFFLVTTTMEVDAGISRNLPIKRDPTEQLPPPKIHDRDILVIMANSYDMLFVEGESMELEDLEDKVRDFYTANSNPQGPKNAQGEIDSDPTMPVHVFITAAICQTNIQSLKDQQTAAPETQKALYDPEIQKWEKKIKTLKVLGVSSYTEISSQALIQLKNQAGTTYGLYIQIQNILKKVVNDLRQEKCMEFGWSDYEDLDEKNPDDLEKLEALTVLVPERIIEAKIEQ